LVLPAAAVPAGFAQHPFAYPIDEPDLFGQRNKAGGRDESKLGMLPAGQGFVGGLTAIGGDEDGLKFQTERLLLNGWRQVVFGLNWGLGGGAKGGLIKVPGALPDCLASYM